MHSHYFAGELKRPLVPPYLQSTNIVARLNFPNMHYQEQEKLSIYAAAQSGLARLESDPEKQLKYLNFIDYYCDLSDRGIQQYQDHYLSKEADIMGLAQLLSKRPA